MTFDRLLARVSLDSPSPLVKQVPTIFAFALAIVLLLVPSPIAHITSPAFFIVAVGLVLLASLLAVAVPWRRLNTEAAIVVPVLSLVAVGFFRLATGGATSPFNAILLLPFVWIATEEGRINALIAAVGTFLVLFATLIPFDGSTTGTDVVRAFYAPVIYLIVAFVINEIAHRVRQQLAAAEAASEQRKELLDRAVRATDELALNEARLKTANRLILSIWNAVTEQSVIGTDLDGLIDVWNPGAEKMLGLTQEQVRAAGRHVVDFHLASELEDRLHDMDARVTTVSSPEDFSALVDAVRAGYAEARDWTYVRADGKHVPVQVTATPRLDENGHRIGFIFVATDMTKAREFARLKDEFVGLISHELRTPLSSILGYLELMRDDEESPLSDEQLQYLGVAERNAHRLLRLVGDLLFTAQVESASSRSTSVSSMSPRWSGRRSNRPGPQHPTRASNSSRRSATVPCSSRATRSGSVRPSTTSSRMRSSSRPPVERSPSGSTVTVRMRASPSATPAWGSLRSNSVNSPRGSSGRRRRPATPSPASVSASPSRRRS